MKNLFFNSVLISVLSLSALQLFATQETKSASQNRRINVSKQTDTPATMLDTIANHATAKTRISNASDLQKVPSGNAPTNRIYRVAEPSKP